MNKTQVTAMKQVARSMSRRCGYLLDVEDLQQEGHLAVLLAERAGTVPADPLHQSLYIRQRARGAMIDAARRAHGRGDDTYHRFVPLDDENPTPGQANVEREHQARQAVRYLMRVMPPRHAQCLAMLYQGMTCTEAAEALGISQAAVTSTKRVAREKLKGSW